MIFWAFSNLYVVWALVANIFSYLQKQNTGGRTKVLLETVPVHKLADIFVASFEISFEEQLSMLDSVDAKVRLSKATELVDRHLQVSNRINDASYLFPVICL